MSQSAAIDRFTASSNTQEPLVKHPSRLGTARLTAALVVALLTQGATAQIPQPLKGAKSSLSQAQIRQRLAPVIAEMDREAEQNFAVAKRDAEALFNSLAPEREAIQKALTADPKYQSLVSQMSAISKGTASAEERLTRMTALANSNRAVFDDAMRVAKIDASALRAKLGASATSNLASAVVKRRSMGSAAVLSSSSKPAPANLGPNEELLDLPFDIAETNTNTGGIAIQSVSADASRETGKANTKVFLDGILGHVRATGYVGNTFSVPTGFSRAKVTFRYRASYRMFALSLGALTVSCGSYDVRVVGIGERPLNFPGAAADDCVVAPVAYFASATDDTDRDVSITFNVPSNQRDFAVVSRSNSRTTLIVAAGGGDSVGHAQISDLRVQFLN
jgi:hypothetical protein